jgi:Ran GTPase-activating protein 1
VTCADLSDIIAGKSEEEALEVLRIICNALGECALVDLNLSDNALGRPGVLACEAVLRGQALEKLYVCNDGLSAEASVTLHEILAKDGMPALKVFHFYNNMSGDGGAVAVADIVRACPLLVDFRFSATRAQRPGCLAVAQALTTLSDLTSLDLGDCMFAGEAALLLGSSLKNFKSLTTLNLRDAGLGEEGVVAVLQALETGPGHGLKVFDISGNDLDADNVSHLNRLLRGTKLLEELSLDDNCIENEGISDLAKSITNCKSLRTLSVCTCELTAAGAYRLAQSVSMLPTFSALKMDGNTICERGVEEIQGLLLRAGKVLVDMEDNDEDGDDDLEEALEEQGECAGEDDVDDDELVSRLNAAKI